MTCKRSSAAVVVVMVVAVADLCVTHSEIHITPFPFLVILQKQYISKNTFSAFIFNDHYIIFLLRTVSKMFLEADVVKFISKWKWVIALGVGYSFKVLSDLDLNNKPLKRLSHEMRPLKALPY